MVSVATGLIQLILDNFFVQQSTKIGVEVNRAFLGHRSVCVDRLISRKKGDSIITPPPVSLNSNWTSALRSPLVAWPEPPVDAVVSPEGVDAHG